MAQNAGSSAAKAGTALLLQRAVKASRNFGVSMGLPRGNNTPCSPFSPFASKLPSTAPGANCVVSSRGSAASYSSSTSTSVGSSSIPTGGVGAPRMLVENPRPTEYQTEICNEALNVKPGVEKSSTKGVVLLTTLLIVVPIVHTKYELHKYYSEYAHFYKTGWDLYHYDKRKSSYLS